MRVLKNALVPPEELLLSAHCRAARFPFPAHATTKSAWARKNYRNRSCILSMVKQARDHQIFKKLYVVFAGDAGVFFRVALRSPADEVLEQIIRPSRFINAERQPSIHCARTGETPCRLGPPLGGRLEPIRLLDPSGLHEFTNGNPSHYVSKACLEVDRCFKVV